MSEYQVTDYDVAICGAGPAGMALAALLAQRGMAPSRIALVDAKPLDAARDDPRTLALSWGSRQILGQVGAWPVPATEIHEIHVSRKGAFGRSMITRDEHRVPALGYVTRYGDIVTVLAGVIERLGIVSLRPARVTGLEETPGGVRLAVDDGRTGERMILAAIAVQAEGGLFGAQADKQTMRDYGQTAIIAQVEASAPIAHRAYERFTDEGPLAMLPQGEGYSMVWCVRPETAQELLSLADAAFLARLNATFGERLGRFTHATRRLAFPLGLNAGVNGTARTTAIGNAAQTLHPVAGQGLNLGLRDATVLARLLARGATPDNLAEFATLRRQDRDATVRLTDTMARIFANTSPLQPALGLSLAAIDLFGPARSVLAELMMYGRR
ncbi:FAD-dependent monooxygenase [Pseudoduganella umbonata]|uniref:2-octaprenyl-6-methoxyphenol hydroxylase n=1 Tax=Pseudoduganella umbonata TaxID=864828 RepID=A0A4P8HTT5_9BURK|nr:FAD-dependent monooxygenase [Pseudoduganella umbonata]MBB3220332.1 2-octaprenyl-6-methoxyphenol hydroxylase [Pseudoduganella umbonata]QCP12128.1 2-octaprenyl-6-methoxyphenyl hydroxylase [Pseudoduganella umbonata]